jgi:predicted nucleotidyltransferase
MTTARPAAEYIPEMVERIVKTFNPVKIILFGSHARGNAGHDSDIDLLVVMDEVENKHDAAVAMRVALLGIPAPKDIVVTTPEEIKRIGHVAGYVLRPALREGRLLHERR